jgi:dihydrofolate synthase / folylpolyglutamate synthase
MNTVTLTYTETIQFLYSLRLFGTKLGLENTSRLAALAGHPQRELRFIHVAGTNGKGSTCAMLEGIYRAAGLRVGLFTSPHLVSFRERIQVNRHLISETDVVRLVEQSRRVLNSSPDTVHPTFFEWVTILALRYFREQHCQLVIWETGLGGRLDATNIVTPLASVITNIQLDHEQWLGSTLAQIAAEKAGIIKPGVPVITATDDPGALEVIQSTACRQGARLTRVGEAESTALVATTQIPLLGEHQRLNAAVALAVVEVLKETLPVPADAIRRGLSQVSWPGRLQRHVTSDGRTILLDGAHNPAGADSVRKAVQHYFPGQQPTLILGVMRDKDWTTMCQTLAPISGRILLAPVHSERTAPPADLRRACLEAQPGLDVDACQDVLEALRQAEKDRFVLVTGSLPFVGEAMEALELLPSCAGERRLNEWDASARGPVVATVL